MQINPVSFLGKTYTQLDIIVESFRTDASTGKVFIILSGENASYEENLTVPADVWAGYGTDDSYIINWVLSLKGLALYVEPVETAPAETTTDTPAPTEQPAG